MNNKKTISLLLIVICLITKITIVDAFGFNGTGGIDTSDHSSSGDPGVSSGEVREKPKPTKEEGDYICVYNSNVTPFFSVEINAYNELGEPIIEESSYSDWVFKSGTRVGIRVEETRGATWSVSIEEYLQKIIEYSCRCRDFDYLSGEVYTYTTGPHEVTASEKPSCGGCSVINATPTTKTVGSVPFDCLGMIASEARSAAKGAADSSVASVKYLKKGANHYPKRGGITLDGLAESFKIKSIDEDGETGGSYTRVYLYKPYNVCMNQKTGEVRYIDGQDIDNLNENSKLCNEDEITVPIEKSVATENSEGGQEYWSYFIPLNTKTGKPFNIRISDSESSLSNEECKNVMDNYPIVKVTTRNGNPLKGEVNWKETLEIDNGCQINGKLTTNKKECENAIRKDDYTKYIVTKDGVSFDPNEDKKNKDNIEKTGCRIEVAVNFNVAQRYYGETLNSDKEKDLKGYKIYYRPINPNNPFPNGVGKDSTWFGLYNKNNDVVTVKESNDKERKYDLKDSFKKLTYVVKSIKPTDKYYTDWSEMNINGINNALDDDIRRNVDRDSIYNLGCGPANADWKECKK